MWILLIVSFQSSGLPIISSIPDLFSKTECREMIQLIKQEVPSNTVEYKCVYLPE